MKLGIITSMAAAPWGGSEELWFSLAKEARLDKCDVSVSVYNWGEKYSKIKTLEKEGVQFYFRSRISFRSIIGKFIGKFNQLFRAQQELKSFVEYEKPDVLFVSMGAFCDFEIDSLRLFLLDTKVPIYIVIHSNTDYYSIDANKIESIKNLCIKACKLYFVSQRMKVQSETQLTFQLTNAEIVKNPVNIKNFEVLKQPSFDSIKMACVGSIIFHVKGQAVLLELLNSKKWKDRNWILSIYGDGPDKMKLVNLIKAYGFEEKVFVKGFSNDIKNDVWKENHILLLPSFIEGMPIALVEAMLCGRTAVANNVGGVKEILKDGVNGYVTDTVSQEAFEYKLEEAWMNKQKWEEMGEIAFEDGLAFFGNNPIKELLNDLKQSV
jgi:glycosyltransferase involved in cell wall biosynthesis